MNETTTRAVITRKPLKVLRQEANLTQRQAARAIRRSGSYISLAERGWSKVSTTEDITLRALYRLGTKAPWMLK